MPHLAVVSHGDSAAVVLPADVLETIGARVGDVLEVTLGEGELVLRPVPDAVRSALVDEIVRDVFQQRADAYRRLA